jgi:heptosyltransferase-2
MNVVARLPNWLGDTVMAVPTLRSLRAGLGSDGGLVLAGPWAKLLADQGIAQRCVVYPRSVRGRLRTADSVGRIRPDVAVVLPNSFEAALSAWYWGARRRVGYDTDGRGFLLTDRVPAGGTRLHQIDEYLGLLAPLGWAATARDPVLDPPAEGRAVDAARGLLRSAGVEGPPVVGIHLGAEFGPSKLWPAGHVASLCDILRRGGATPVLLGPPAAADVARGVIAATAGRPASVVGRDTPDVLPALLAALDVVVSGDTGVAHLAAALGVPVVVLFGPTDPARSAPRGRVRTIAKETPCAPCFYRRCPIEHPCLRAIAADEVAAAVRGALGDRSAIAARPPLPPITGDAGDPDRAGGPDRVNA